MAVRFFRSHVCCLLGLSLLGSSCRTKVQPANYRERIGIAVKLGDRVCMAIRNSKLLPSATITLLEPLGLSRERATTARALVLVRNAEACPGTKSDGELSNYDLLVTTGTLDPNLPTIALDARVPSVLAAHSFHSCASADGIHLTAWDGAKPLEGHRLWKQYYYSSQDLKQNCTAAETAP